MCNNTLGMRYSAEYFLFKYVSFLLFSIDMNLKKGLIVYSLFPAGIDNPIAEGDFYYTIAEYKN
ncbi:hypothetical protein AC625_11660 [Peribacillus loiseleuriae]|uniref:Uncharacterized protein n=1 Tax=Peribacillus loiseleuriae TaxID=1679170 RepID=A0A0K9GV04_9BACI|nr:hypothetical protein AC625_11660 [Peribacillus loiseleuriae]